MAEGQQQFPLHTTGFEITHQILLALSGQVKPIKHGISVFLHKWKTIHWKAEKVQKIGHHFHLFLWKAFGKAPKSSSMAEGQQELPAHHWV